MKTPQAEQSQGKAGRPQERVHIPLDFKEALSDLLKVEPPSVPKPNKRKRPPKATKKAT